MVNDYEIWDNTPDSPFRELPDFKNVSLEGDPLDIIGEGVEVAEGEEVRALASPAPSQLAIIGTDVQLHPDGKVTVDVDLQFEGVTGAVEYDVRLA